MNEAADESLRLLSVKKVRLAFCVSCGSTHKIEFAKQIHKVREHVSRNLYKGRKNVPVRARFFFSIRSKAWFRARGCSENVSFSTASEAADKSLRLLRACGNIHEDMHKPVDKFEDGTFPCFSYMVY